MNWQKFFLALALILSLKLSPSALADDPGANSVFDPTAIDASINPCDDFYQYACGNWLKRTSIPSDESDWARSFSVINNSNENTLREILESYSAGKIDKNVPYAKKMARYYQSCMDTGRVEKESPKNLSQELRMIDRLKNKKDLPALIAKLHLSGISVFFSFGSTLDLLKPTTVTGEIDQGGMTLPDNTYYLKTDDDSKKLVEQYKDHIRKMFSLAGYSAEEANSEVEDVLAVEMTLAQNALPPEDLQDSVAIYHPLDEAALRTMVPDFNWKKYFQHLGIKNPKITNVTEAKFMGAVNSLLINSSIEQIRRYLKWHVLESLAPYAGQKLHEEFFNFEDNILYGEQTMSPRWKTCVRAVGRGMGEALGQAYVAKKFGPEARDRANAMIANLHTAFENDLKDLDWLDEATRTAALKKLSLMTKKIGYPDHWKDYTWLWIDHSYLKNSVRATILATKRNLDKIGKPADLTEWDMTPQTVNAYYDPSRNQINFPAGILQPPFFAQEASDASNYGAIGVVIGHEMTHGFDTSGSKMDGTGMKNDWWSADVKKIFEQKAECLENQYSQYAPLPGLHVNGKLTITENIADSGGLKLAYNAYKLSRQGKQEEAPIGNITADQQFFLGMAQAWCDEQTDAGLKQQLSGDPHSPAKYRVIGTMVNHPGFAAAFGCQAGSPMAPKDRCPIW